MKTIVKVMAFPFLLVFGIIAMAAMYLAHLYVEESNIGKDREEYE